MLQSLTDKYHSAVQHFHLDELINSKLMWTGVLCLLVGYHGITKKHKIRSGVDGAFDRQGQSEGRELGVILLIAGIILLGVRLAMAAGVFA